MKGLATTTALLAAMQVPDEVIKAYRLAVRQYGARRWVTGIAVGRKFTKGRLARSPRWAVVIHVRTKRPKSKVGARSLIPPTIGGVPTDVVQGRYRRQAKTSPGAAGALQSGDAIATANGKGGTLGGVLEDGTGAAHVLTAAHVLRSGGGKKGTTVVHPPSSAAAPGTPIAVVSAIHLSHDVGLAALLPGTTAGNTTPPGVDVKPPVMPTVDLDVAMFGAASGTVRRGRITQVGQTSVNGTFPVVFIRVAGAPPVGGDSGAVWYDTETSHAVGLHVEMHVMSSSGAGASGKVPHAVATIATVAVSGLSKVLKHALTWL